jgi:hypothetical protein
LSGAYASVAGEPSAVYWNPAALAPLKATRVEASHVERGAGIRTESLFFSQPLAGGATFGAGASWLSQPPVEVVVEDASGNVVHTGETLVAFQFRAAGGLGQELSRLLDVPALGALWGRGSVGAALNLLGERLGDATDVSASVDLGYRYTDENEGRWAALVARQVGVSVRGRPLPFSLHASVAQRFESLLWIVDGLTGVDDAFRLRGAVEWTYGGEESGLSLRAGVQHSFASRVESPYSAGVGYRFALPGAARLAFEYAYTPVRGFADLHAASVQVAL